MAKLRPYNCDATAVVRRSSKEENVRLYLPQASACMQTEIVTGPVDGIDILRIRWNGKRAKRCSGYKDCKAVRIQFRPSVANQCEPQESRMQFDLLLHPMQSASEHYLHQLVDWQDRTGAPKVIRQGNRECRKIGKLKTPKRNLTISCASRVRAQSVPLALRASRRPLLS
jgi:hypothetical protein